MDRTLKHSVNLMDACTSDKKFIYMQLGYPGSVYDSLVFTRTNLHETLDTDPRKVLPHSKFLITQDSAFALK